jgi:hypothetical protein
VVSIVVKNLWWRLLLAALKVAIAIPLMQQSAPFIYQGF